MNEGRRNEGKWSERRPRSANWIKRILAKRLWCLQGNHNRGNNFPEKNAAESETYTKDENPLNRMVRTNASEHLKKLCLYEQAIPSVLRVVFFC